MRWFGVRLGPVAVVLAFALTLAGCEIDGVEGVLGEPTSAPAAARPTREPAEAPTVAVSPGTPVASRTAPQPVAQQATPTPLPASVVQQLTEQEQIVANVYQRVAPAVVRISTGQGLGSGFLIDTDGHIVTNNHVIAGSGGEVRVAFTGLFETIGQVVGADPDSDTAVVKVDELPEDVVPVELGDSDQVRVGQLTIAIGNPLGQDRTVTTGIVSAVGRTIDERPGSYAIGGAIQTDAAINPGNSGGPLLNAAGQVIGMNTAILSPSGVSSGIGFAVPVNLTKKVVPALIERGRYDHPWLGVQMGEITTLEARRNNLPTAGILIAPDPNAGEASPALQAGLRDQAILTAIDGQAMTSTEAVIAYLELNKSPGDTVTLTLTDIDGRQRDLQVQLGARPSVADREQPPQGFPFP
jgi:2-alkenal reductase